MDTTRLHARISELEGQLAKRDKIVRALRSRVERSLHPEHDAFFLFETNVLLKEQVQQRTQEYEQALDRVVAADKAKGEFLANMSHELRTPMNGVIGIADLLAQTSLDEVQRDYVDTIRRSGDALLALISNILDFSKIEAGKIDLEEVEFDPTHLIEDVSVQAAVLADSKGIDLALYTDPNVPSVVRADPHRLRQVLVNLVGNAVKFTSSGHVFVELLRVDESDGSGRLKFVISDTGIGMSEDQTVSIFKPFTQADASTTRQFGGTGLGLAITQRLIGLMRGTLVLETRPGEGSTFQLEIPAATVPGCRASDAPLARDELERTRILLVGEPTMSQQTLARYLREIGVGVQEVANAADARTQLCQTASDGSPYAAVISDADLADGTSDDLFRWMESEASVEVPLRVVLVSISRQGSIALGSDSPATHYLVRPIRRSRLLDLIRAMHSGSSAAHGDEAQANEVVPNGSRSSAPPRSGGLTRVLLAEDNPVNQMVALRMLERQGCSVAVANDGERALELVKSESFELVFMDCQMPAMDGYDATRCIRALDGDAARIPIIAMTANAMVGDREKCLASGMSDYLSKPVRAGELTDMLQKWRRRGASSAAS